MGWSVTSMMSLIAVAAMFLGQAPDISGLPVSGSLSLSLLVRGNLHLVEENRCWKKDNSKPSLTCFHLLFFHLSASFLFFDHYTSPTCLHDLLCIQIFNISVSSSLSLTLPLSASLSPSIEPCDRL